MAEHRLINKNGSLYIKGVDGEDMILLHRYPEGDCDRISWPLAQGDDKLLESCLFDEGNMDRVAAGPVFLPDGKLFGEIVPCGFEMA